MGKYDDNLPANVSLSHTLTNFYSEVSMELISGDVDIFINDLGLNQQSVDRFLLHLGYIKFLMNFRGNFSLTSKNNFSHSIGIASSASSFAALTMCAFKAICSITSTPLPSNEYMSGVSRRASGSSCRSFFAPWSIWKNETAEKIDLGIGELLHNVVIVDATVKKISSSEAHRRVRGSLLFNGRIARAQARYERLVTALEYFNAARWHAAYQICWEEFWDMHALFETSSPCCFGYMQPETIHVLLFLRNFWEIYEDGPLVTIDAGPNVHLLWRMDQKILRNQCISGLQDMSIIFQIP
jgi:diphosphomevalonate decarboxylase